MTVDTENFKNSCATDTLIEHCLDIPLSFAIWHNQGEYVLISSKMQSLLKLQSLTVPSIDFVRGVSSIFDSFLYDAVEKLSGTQFSNRKYSVNFSTKYNKTYTLTLRYNARSDVYIFTVVDVIQPLPRFTNDQYSKKTTLPNTNTDVLSEILDNLPLYVWQKDKKAKLLYCNKEYAHALNMSVSDAIKNNTQLFKTSSLSLKQDGSRHGNLPATVNGKNKNLRITELVSKTNGDYIIGFADEYIDIQSIKTKYEDYKRWLFKISESVPDGVVLFDSNNDTVVFSENALRLLELTRSDVDGQGFYKVVDLIFSKEIFVHTTKDYRNKLLSIIKNADNDVTVKFVPLCSGKTIRVSIIINEDKTLLLLIKDVTNDLYLEREIKSVRSVCKSVLNNIFEGIVIFGSDNRFKFVNSVACNIFNKSEPALIDIHIKDCFQEVIPENADAFIESLVASAETRISNTEIINFSGKTFECVYSPLHEGLNLLKFRDLSDFKSLEKDLQNASEQVAKINELKNNLITTISEEYTAPLDTIMNIADILNNKYFGELNEKQTEYCQSIIKTASQLKDIADAVTNIAIILTDKVNFTFEETDINELVQNVVDGFAKIDPDHSIKFEPSKRLFKAYIDINFVRKAVYNAILSLVHRNAQKHSIEVKVCLLNEQDTFFEIEITDTEADIIEKEADIYNRSFSSGFQLNDLKTIDVCYVLTSLIITKLTGCIKIMPAENNGTTIKIQLPIQKFFS